MRSKRKPTKRTPKKAEKSFANDSIWTPLSSRPYGYGYGYGFRDAPGSWDLLGAFNDVVYSAINLIAPNVAREADKYKLVVRTTATDERPKSLTKKLDYQAKQQINERYPQYSRRAVEIEEVADHGLLDILDYPNPHQSFRKLVELIDVYLELVGSAFVYVKRVQGIPSALWVLPSQYMTIETDESGFLTGYRYKAHGEERYYRPEDIIHFKFVNPVDPYTSFGVSPTRAVWERISLLESETRSWQSVLDNITFPTMLISPPEGDVYTPQQAERIEKQLSEKGRLANNGGAWVIPDAMKVSPFSTPPKDMSALQLYQALRNSVSSAFNVPLSMLDLNESGSNSGPNAEASDTVRRNFQRYCLLPRIEMILETFSHALCPPRMWLIADTTVSPDKVFELQKATAAFAGGGTKLNEFRGALGYPPDERLGDKYQFELMSTGTASAQTFQTSFTPPKTKSRKVRYHSSSPDPAPLVEALRPVMERLGESILGKFGGKGFVSYETKSFIPLDQWTEEMKRSLVPVLRVYLGEGADGVLGAVGGSPEIQRHAVQEIDKAVNGLVLALAESTLATTNQSVESAVSATREAIRAGLDKGEAAEQLSVRLGEIFTDLTERRCLLIAETESSRAKHAGELIAIESAGVKAKKQALPDNMACDICRRFQAKGFIPLDQPYEKGSGPYGTIQHPPFHVQCRCSQIYELE